MRFLQADPGTLALLADRCRVRSADLASPPAQPAPQPCSSAPETDAAIRAVDAAAAAVSDDLARRAQQAAAALDDAARGLRSHEYESAATLG